MRTIAIAFAAITLAACTGTVRVKSLTKEEFEKSKLADSKGNLTNEDLNGVVFYPLMTVYEVSAPTRRVDKDGKIVAWALEPRGPMHCVPQRQFRLITKADYEKPKLIYYDYGLLEAYKFTPTMSADGLLLSLSTESTPDRGQTLKNIADATGTIAGLPQTPGARVTSDGQAYPVCNSDSVVLGYLPYDPNKPLVKLDAH